MSGETVHPVDEISYTIKTKLLLTETKFIAVVEQLMFQMEMSKDQKKRCFALLMDKYCSEDKCEF